MCDSEGPSLPSLPAGRDQSPGEEKVTSEKSPRGSNIIVQSHAGPGRGQKPGTSASAALTQGTVTCPPHPMPRDSGQLRAAAAPSGLGLRGRPAEAVCLLAWSTPATEAGTARPRAPLSTGSRGLTVPVRTGRPQEVAGSA